MRKSDAEAAKTRRAIVAAAADHIRRTGIVEASLADIMAQAGLTHGGFYKHFKSKEQLVAEATQEAGESTIAAISRNLAKGGFTAAVASYLSRTHRDAQTPVCPFAALGSEIARSGDGVKDAATDILQKLSATLASDSNHPNARADALAALSTMVGAMTLARVASDRALSAEILESAKKHLQQSRNAGARRR